VISDPSVTESVRPRVLVEGSKLADEKMDGIKRYVTELLLAYRDGDHSERFDIDVAIRGHAYPLAEVPSRYLPRPDGSDEDELLDIERPLTSARHRIFEGLGVLIPPILLHPIKWLVSDSVARRVFGKSKDALTVPRLTTDARNIVVLLVPPAVIQLLQGLLPNRIALSLWARGVFLMAPQPVDLDGYDLVHLTLPNNFHYLPPTQLPVVVTVHDLCHLACPEHQTRANSMTLELGITRSLESGASFLSVSEATRTQMIDAYALEPSRATAVHSGCNAEWFHPVDDPAHRERVRRKYKIPDGPFLLTLSTIEPRKNLAGALRAFDLLIKEYDQPDVVLVIAGARGWKSRNVFRQAGLSPDRVHLTGYIDDQDLAALYSEARGFVFASHYEGFGFPVLEAMRCGIPVIYGNNSALPEIVADAGLPVDADDVRDIARQLDRLLTDDDLARTFGKRALYRASEFSWARTAQETLAVYEQVLLNCSG
jgi:glycosyltransferase involved in cell wall biosynthesis